MKKKKGWIKVRLVKKGDDILQLSIYATQFKINEREIVLVSIKNIHYIGSTS